MTSKFRVLVQRIPFVFRRQLEDWKTSVGDRHGIFSTVASNMWQFSHMYFKSLA